MANWVRMQPGWERQVQLRARPVLSNAADDIAADVERNLARHTVTGALAASVKSPGNTVRVGTDHWQFIEFGTKPHLITTRKRSLRTHLGRFIGNRVRHPGTRAYAPIRRAVFKKRRPRRH